MKKLITLLIAMVFASFTWGQTVLISPTGDGGFETGSSLLLNNWTAVNSTLNTWQVSAVAVPYAGANSAFISNDAGVSYLYTNTTPQASHFYRDVTVPVGESKIALSFQWKGNGETGYDRLLVYTAPTTVTPVIDVPTSGTTITGATLVYTQTALQAAYGLQTIALPGSLAGTTFRLIFTWQNDNSGGINPPTSIDDISLTSALPTTYYWVGATGGTWNTAANWNTSADGTGTTRTTPVSSDILIVDGAGTVAGAATTISVDLASFSIGQFKVTSNTACTLESSATTTRTITITGSTGDDFVIENGSALNLINSTKAIGFAFSGTGNTGNISGSYNASSNTSNVINANGGTGTVFTVASTGVVNNGIVGSSGCLTGSVATLVFANGSNYTHSAFTSSNGLVPLATWGATSNISITGGTTSTSISNAPGQTFGNFTYNSSTSTGTMSIFTTNTTIIQGNLNVLATNTGKVRVVTTGTLTVNGNLNVSGGTTEVSNNTGTLNVLGDINVSGGTFDIAFSSTPSLKVAGNFVQTAGNIIQTSATGTLEFNGVNPQTLTLVSGSHGANVINVKINNTAGVDLTSAFLIRNLTVTKGNLTGAGSLAYNGTNSLLTYNGVTGAQTASVVEFPATAGPSSLTINNTSTSPTNVVSIPFTRRLAGTTGVLTLTSGILDNSTYVLNISNTATGGVSGGSATSYVKGAIGRDLPVSLLTGSTFLFPVGKSEYKPLELVNPLTNAGGTVVTQAEVFDANCGGTLGTNMSSLNTDRYWNATITSGAANFTSSTVQVTEAGLTGNSGLASSTTLTGAYNLVSTLTATATTIVSDVVTSLDYFVVGVKSVPMVYVSSTTTQASIASLLQNSTDQAIIGIQVVTANNASPLDVTKFTLNAFKTNNLSDISNAKVWYTGTSSVFAATSQFGSTFVAPTLVDFDVVGTQTLVPGTNYFWLTFDIPLTAFAADTVDAQCTNVTVAAVDHAPTVTAPAGYRLITLNPPTALVATAVNSNEIDLTWTKNSVGQDVMVAVNSANTFGTPVNGTPYIVGATLPTAGTIIYNGPASGFNHTLLTANTAYYYKAWSVDANNYYSATGATATATTPCAVISTFPFTESFSAALGCWSAAENTAGASYHWVTTTADATHGPAGSSFGTHFAYLYVYNASTTYNPYYLISPSFSLDASAKQLKYYYWLGSSGYQTTPVPMTVQISVDGGSIWTDLYAHTSSNSTFTSTSSVTGWTQNVVSLAAYTNQTVKFRFASNSNFGSGYCDQGIDEFTVEAIPTCPAPTALNATSVLTTSATLGWTAGGSEPTWHIEYGPSGFTLGTGTKVYTSLNPAIVSGLTPATVYDFYVKAVCSGTDSSSYSAVKGTFTTQCANVTVFPYTQSFDGTTFAPICWGNIKTAGTGALWQRSTSGSFPTCAPHTGAGMAYFNSFSASGTIVELSTSALDIPNDNYRVSFWMYRDDGYATYYDSLAVYYSISNTTVGATKLIRVNRSRSYAPVETGANGWYKYTVNLPAGSGGTGRYIIFEGTSKAGNNIFVDDVVIEAIPSCNAPTLPTATVTSASTATLGWTVNGTETAWRIEYGPTGFTVGTGTKIYTTSNPTLVTGLTQNTAYTYYVKALCTASDTSSITDAKNFTTPYSCLVPTAPVATNITATSADLGWTAGGTELGWQVEFGLNPMTPGSGIKILRSVNNLPIPSGTLTPSTKYDFRVRAICAPGDTSIWTSLASFTTLCNSVTTLPYNETFDAPLFPSCWSKSMITGTSPAWVDTTGFGSAEVPSPHSGTRFIGKYYNSSASLLTSPQFALTGITTSPQMKVWVYRGTSAHSSDSISFYVNTANSLTGATRLGKISRLYTTAPAEASGNAWYQYTFNIPASFNSTPFFVMALGTTSGGFSSYSLGLDDFLLQEKPACSQPLDLTATPLSPTSMSLGWTPGGSETTWRIAYSSTFPFDPEAAGTKVLTTQNPKTITGLSSNTSYQFYVKGICSANDSTVYSGPFTFTTPCSAITTLPYTNDFEVTSGTIPGCWSRSLLSGTTEWGADDYNDGCPSAHSGTYFMGKSYSNSEAVLVSPQFALSGITSNPELKIWIYRNSDGMPGDSIAFYVNTTQVLTGATKLGRISTNIIELPTENVVGWYQYTYELPALYNTTPFYVLTLGKTSDGAASYGLGMDDFLLREKPGCVEPSALTVNSVTTTTATVSWTSGGASNWNIEYGLQGFTPGTGTIKHNVSNPYTIVGLNPSTAYDFYVQDSCAAGLVSPFFGPQSQPFVTECVVNSSFPWLEAFEGTNFPPACWSVVAQNTGYTWMATTYTSHSPTKCAAVPYNFTQDEQLLTPAFNFATLTHPVFEFWYMTSTYLPSSFNITLWVSTNGGSTWTSQLWDKNSDVVTSSVWVSRKFDLTAFAGQTNMKFKFEYIGDDGDAFFLDDVSIAEGDDLAVTSPKGNFQLCNLTSTVPVSMHIKNVGSKPVAAGEKIYTYFKIDALPLVKDSAILVSSLVPGDSISFNFTTTADFLAYQLYHYTTYLRYYNDIRHANDTTKGTIEHMSFSFNPWLTDTIHVTSFPYELKAGYGYNCYRWNNNGLCVVADSNHSINATGWQKVRVQMYDNCNGVDSVYINLVTGIDENNAFGNMSIFPNPTTGKLTLTISGINEKVKLSVVSTHGQEIYTDEFYATYNGTNRQIDLSALPKGIYFIKLANDNAINVKKVVVY